MTAVDERAARLDEIRDSHTSHVCRNCTDEVLWLLRQVEFLTAGLRAITIHEPPFEVAGPDPHCSDCHAIRDKGWPPSGLCVHHYRELAARERRNEASRAGEGWVLKEIARAALRGEVPDAV